MGLPIFQEPNPSTESQLRTKESYAINGHPRTSIRRRDPPVWARSRTIRSPPPPHFSRSLVPVPPIPRQHLATSTRAPRRSHNYVPEAPEVPTVVPPSTTSGPPNGVSPSTLEDQAQGNDTDLLSRPTISNNVQLTASPQPMVHLDDDATTAPPSPNRDEQIGELPPLRRMGRRSINDSARPMTMIDENGTEYAVRQDEDGYLRVNSNGLGDRTRSITPDEDQWHTLFTTITPDPSVPSADSSFAPVSGSAEQLRRQRSMRQDHPDRVNSIMRDSRRRPVRSRSIHESDPDIQGTYTAAMSAAVPSDRTREAARRFSQAVAGESGVFDYVPRPRSSLRNTQTTEPDFDEEPTTNASPDENTSLLRNTTTHSLSLANDEPSGNEPSQVQELERHTEVSPRRAESSEHSSDGFGYDWDATSDSEPSSNTDTTPPTSASIGSNGDLSIRSQNVINDAFRRLGNHEINRITRRLTAYRDVSLSLELHDEAVSSSPYLRNHADETSQYTLNRIREIVGQEPTLRSRGPQNQDHISHEHEVSTTRHEMLDYISSGDVDARERRRRRQRLRNAERWQRRNQTNPTSSGPVLNDMRLDVDVGAAVEMR